MNQDTIASVSAFFAYVDKDGDGFITPSEAQAAMAVDYNSDGVVSGDEQVKAGAQWVQNGPFAAQDLDGDQKITLVELLSYNERTRQ